MLDQSYVLFTPWYKREVCIYSRYKSELCIYSRYKSEVYSLDLGDGTWSKQPDMPEQR